MKPRYNVLYGFSKMVVCLGSRVFFWRSIVGREHWIPGPALVAANHASFLDPPLVGSSCPEQVAYLARKSLFRNAFFRKLCYGLDAIPFDRGTVDFGSIKRVLTALRRGKKVLVFPEGVRTFDGDFRAPMAGVGFLVHQARVPVIPAYVHGTYRAWPRHRVLPLPGKVVVVFGPPVRFDAPGDTRPTREAYQAIADEVMARIIALKPQARSRM